MRSARETFSGNDPAFAARKTQLASGKNSSRTIFPFFTV